MLQVRASDTPVKLVLRTDDMPFLSVNYASHTVRAASYSSRDSAEAAAFQFSFDQDTRQLKGPSNQCLIAPGSEPGFSTECSLKVLGAVQWHVDTTGYLYGDVYGVRQHTYLMREPNGLMRFESRASALAQKVKFASGFGFGDYFAGVRAGSIDVAARSAVIEGRAEPNADIIINDTIPAKANADGVWSKELTGLKLGKQSVKVEQYVDGERVGDPIQVEVELAVAPLTINDAFSSDLNERVRLFGAGQKGADVVVRTPDEKQYVTPVADDGTWEFALPAPNKGGSSTITVAQRLPKTGGGSDETAPVDYTINYGAGVSVASPSDDSVHDGGPLEMTGRGQYESSVTVTEKGSGRELGTARVLQNGIWSLTTTDLDAGEHTLVASQLSKGRNTTLAEVTINPGASSVADPTGSVTFDKDVTKKATVSGTGVDGATITLFQGASSKQIGSASVVDGTWSTTIDPIGPGDQRIRIEQSGIEGVQTAETTAKYGAGVVLDDPESTTVAPGTVTVTGSGQADATVTITGGVAPVTATVGANGVFSADVELAPSHSAATLTATQISKGNLRTTDAFTLTPDGAQQAREVVVTEPSSHTYKAGQETTVRGAATPYAEIEIRFQWSDAVQGKVTADKNGNWSFTRAYGPAAKYELTAKQTRYDGSTSTSAKFTLNPEGITNRDVVITGPANHTYTPGQPTRITGTATPYANIEIRFQWNDTVYGRATANADGNWNIIRQYGPGATYDITAKQLRADGTTSYSETFSLSPENTNRPLTLTTPEMTSTFQPDQDVSFTGTGTPGATITAIAPDWNNGLIFQTKVDNNGNWKQLRKFTPGLTYNLTILHQPIDGDETSIEGIHLNPAN